MSDEPQPVVRESAPEPETMPVRVIRTFETEEEAEQHLSELVGQAGDAGYEVIENTARSGLAMAAKGESTAKPFALVVPDPNQPVALTGVVEPLE